MQPNHRLEMPPPLLKSRDTDNNPESTNPEGAEKPHVCHRPFRFAIHASAEPRSHAFLSNAWASGALDGPPWPSRVISLRLK